MIILKTAEKTIREFEPVTFLRIPTLGEKITFEGELYAITSIEHQICKKGGIWGLTSDIIISVIQSPK